MSFDLAVWEPSRTSTPERAQETYVALAEDPSLDTNHSPAFQSFMTELVAVYPDLDTLRDDDAIEASPWASGFSRGGSHAILYLQGESSDDACDLVLQLARKYGLVVYDPQSSKLHLPTAAADAP